MITTEDTEGTERDSYLSIVPTLQRGNAYEFKLATRSLGTRSDSSFHKRLFLNIGLHLVWPFPANRGILWLSADAL